MKNICLAYITLKLFLQCSNADLFFSYVRALMFYFSLRERI